MSGTIKVYHVIAHHSTVGRPSLGDNFAVSAFLTGFTKEAEMRMVVLGELFLGASAQVVVHDRGDVVVHRNYDRGHHYGRYKHLAECRTVRVRTRLPNGNVIIKTRQSC